MYSIRIYSTFNVERFVYDWFFNISGEQHYQSGRCISEDEAIRQAETWINKERRKKIMRAGEKSYTYSY